jgi:uncharacterized phiE125 gp8 family phage protein
MGVLAVATAPETEPLDLATVKLHLRLIEDIDSGTDYESEDTLLTGWITAARQVAEHETLLSLITTVWDYYLDEWPDDGYIALPRPPLQSVDGVYYTFVDEDEAEYTDYTADTASRPGRVVRDYNCTWPSGTYEPNNPIRIRFTAGYGDAATDVPFNIRAGMLTLIAHWYENRETTTPVSLSDVPMTAKTLFALNKLQGSI